MGLWVLSVIVAIVDQGIKYYIQSTMLLEESIPVINGVFHITYILNPGAAFGMLKHQTTLFLVVAIGLVVALGFYTRIIMAGHWGLRLGAGLLAGGAVSNAIDRAAAGHVVDFLDFRIWPVFNLADVAIVTGMGCLVYVVVFLPQTLPGAD